MKLQAQPPQQDVHVLDVGSMEIVLGIIAVTVLIGGLLVILSRGRSGRSDGNMSTIRSWLAVALVSGLILFCAVSLAIPDSSMRSTLFGGLIASAGAASAFYFASSNSDQARKDILDASFGTMEVPDLVNKTLDQVHEVVARSAMELQVQPSDAAGTATVRAQDPPAGVRVRRGSTLTVSADDLNSDKDVPLVRAGADHAGEGDSQQQKNPE